MAKRYVGNGTDPKKKPRKKRGMNSAIGRKPAKAKR